MFDDVASPQPYASAYFYSSIKWCVLRCFSSAFCPIKTQAGMRQRTTAATLYNTESSRSHALFELHVQSKYKDGNSGTDLRSTSRLSLVHSEGCIICIYNISMVYLSQLCTPF